MSTRLRLTTLSVALAVAGAFLPHHQHQLPEDRVAASVVVSPHVIDSRDLPPRASRSRPVAAKPKVVVKPKAVTRPKVVKKVLIHTGCTSSTWRSTLGVDEAWIDRRESDLDPTPADVNPSSGARGLGQLLNSTYRSLGLTPSWDPCEEIVAQRAYMKERYGSWAAARSFWERHRWW